jgi:NAD(P)-dependent dehydrogenase (short-subunit alcohol dehydrogenase family)
MSASANGKTVLVTGATSGIGEATARGLAQQGATVIVVGRNLDKCTATVNRLKQQTGNANIDDLLADLASQKEIYRLVEEFRHRYTRLDVLINNAGINLLQRQLSPDGTELVFATNHLSYFLLTLLLLDVLKAGAPARIVNVSSFVHRRASLDFDQLQTGGSNAYPLSKLANLLFTYELARRLEGTNVTVNALNPGLVRSNFGLNIPGPAGLIKRLMNALIGVSPEEGAKTSLYLAISPEVEGVTGKYFEKCKPIGSSPISYDKDAARRLWQVSAELTGLSSH